MFGEEEMEIDWIPKHTLIHFSRHVAFELERAIYEAKQAKSLARFQTLAKSAPMGIVLADPKGNIQFANPAFSDIIGYEVKEIIDKSFKDFTLEEDIDSNIGDLRQVAEGEKGFISITKRYRHKKGNVIWAKVTISSMLPKGSKQPEVIAIIEDITDKVHREQEVNRINAAYEQQRLLMVAGKKLPTVLHGFTIIPKGDSYRRRFG
ncbi:PAS domain S-box protein [Okeania hirsuta]|uniref:histidine kinase n=2 Tax=Okeania hirsuta TaxID=1458930 RepID=A0A3N6PQ06_9CYAN|nr:PAS domain S-box protein [Okeania hirsuta]